MTEAKLNLKIRDWLNDQPETYAWRNHGGPHGTRGMVDIGCVHAGRFYGFEVKLPGKEHTLTKIQTRNLQKIRRAGGVAEMVTSVEQVKEVLYGNKG